MRGSAAPSLRCVNHLALCPAAQRIASGVFGLIQSVSECPRHWQAVAGSGRSRESRCEIADLASALIRSRQSTARTRAHSANIGQAPDRSTAPGSSLPSMEILDLEMVLARSLSR